MQSSRELTLAWPVQVKLPGLQSSLWPHLQLKGSMEAAQASVVGDNPKISSAAELCLVPAREAAPSPSANKGDTLRDIQTISTVKLLLMAVSTNQRQKIGPSGNFATITKQEKLWKSRFGSRQCLNYH